jgi:hypothetical protein
MTEPVREGALSIAFLNPANEPVLTTDLQESADHADEFLARYLIQMIVDVGTESAVVTIARADGRPAYADRLLWSLLERLAAKTASPRVDLVVAGPEGSWSFRTAAAA